MSGENVISLVSVMLTCLAGVFAAVAALNPDHRKVRLAAVALALICSAGAAVSFTLLAYHLLKDGGLPLAIATAASWAGLCLLVAWNYRRLFVRCRTAESKLTETEPDSEKFTSRGLTWAARHNSATDAGWGFLAFVYPDGDLPQPLVLRVRSSKKITKLRPTIEERDPPHGIIELKHEIVKDGEARIILGYPKLKSPAFLTVLLEGESTHPATVKIDRLAES